MGTVKKTIRKAKRYGLSNVDILKIKETARKNVEKMEVEATERAFLYMLAIPLNILFHDHWQKTAKKKAPKFIKDVISYYHSVQEGVVSEQELADLLYELAGVKITAEWMKGKENERTETT